jgi:cytochrome d ubiquinol oxidase subunit II
VIALAAAATAAAGPAGPAAPTPAVLLGGVLLVALIFYALFGGADYGGGIWDLLASGKLKREQRAAIEHAIGPIWEANHVWLVLVVVVLFTGFPAAFSAIASGLFVPLVLLLIGIVLRGAAFTFRTYDDRGDAAQQLWGRAFSMSSVLAPLVLGDVVGSIASGHVEGPASGAWLEPFPLVTGAFTAALFAFLAATYLAVESEGALREQFRRRGIAAGAVVGALALAAYLLSAKGAPLVHQGLTARAWAWPLQIATAAAAVTAFAALELRAVRLARLAAVAQVSLIVAGWGVSQYPYLLVDSITLASASAPPQTQVLLLYVLAGGAVLLFPSLYLLFRVFKGERPFAIVDRREPRTKRG